MSNRSLVTLPGLVDRDFHAVRGIEVGGRKMTRFVINWRIEGSWECDAATPEDAQDQFDHAWENGRITPERDGELSNDTPMPVNVPVGPPSPYELPAHPTLLQVAEATQADIESLAGDSRIYGCLITDPTHPWYGTWKRLETAILAAKGEQGT
jgi:hypothetical protein